MAGLIILAFFVLVAILAPILISPESLDVTKATGERFDPPSFAYPLGTDEDGRSILLLLAYGTRISLTVGLAATIISMVIGTAVGIMAGHFRGVGSHALVGVTAADYTLAELVAPKPSARTREAQAALSLDAWWFGRRRRG